MRRRNTPKRRTPNSLVVMVSAGLLLSIAALVLWPKPKTSTKASQKARAAMHATKKIQTTDTKQTPEPQADTKAVKAYSGIVRGPLPHSMRKKLGSENARFLSALAARLLIWKMDIRRDLRRGDKISILYKPVDNQSKFEILAMKYKSQKYSKSFDFYKYKEAKKKFASFYDHNGQNIELQLKHNPLHSYQQVTSILKMRRKHKGVDFKTPTGTKVYLPYRSRVIRKTWNFRFNGNCMEVEFLGGPRRGTRGLFLHLQKIQPIVKPGRILAAGTFIALTGNTGHSTAPHLHYQLQNKNARRIFDPYKLQGTYKRTLPPSEMGSFQKHRRELERMLRSLNN